MARRRIGQSSLAETLLSAGAGTNRPLERIAGLIDWVPFERLLMPLRTPAGPAIRRWPFKALLPAQWSRLSDRGRHMAATSRGPEGASGPI